MKFNSLIFVLLFAASYPLLMAVKHRPQNRLLLLASYLFYGWWDYRFLGLLLATTTIDFFCAQGVQAAATEQFKRRAFVAVSVCANLAILGLFKYFNFFAESATRLFQVFGLHADPITLRLLLPVGISFYTFQSLGYTIDVYRGRIRPAARFADYALFVSFFPQLLAGPIGRATQLLPQVENPRRVTYEDVRQGAWLILLGFFKKVVVADNLADIANAVFNFPNDYRGGAVLVGVYAYAFQIYGDFSGYSDIARGLARLMGFDLMVNFRMPYFAVNPQDFWRRWHISLSTWLHDYLYVPLGGNRQGRVRTCRNLLLTLVLGGLWHGAAWHFVMWGAYHGLLLVGHRALVGGQKAPPARSGWGRMIRILLMFHATCLGWILFRVTSLSEFTLLLGNMFHEIAPPRVWVAALCLLAFPLLLLNYFMERSGDLLVVKRWAPPWRWLTYSSLFAFIVYFGKSNGNAFIYFQF